MAQISRLFFFTSEPDSIRILLRFLTKSIPKFSLRSSRSSSSISEKQINFIEKPSTLLNIKTLKSCDFRKISAHSDNPWKKSKIKDV